MQIRSYFPTVGRFSAHLAVTMAFVIATGITAHSSANAAVRGQAAKISSVQAKGWQSPPGNGDYVFIDAPAAGSTAEGTVTISGRAGTSSTDPNGGGGGSGNGFATKPQVVIAMIDTGGNPYHVDFRDETRLVHPSTYLTGFPSTAKAAPLCFVDGAGTVASPFTYNDNCQTSFLANVAADNSAVAVNDLVWYPGTRLMSKSFAHDDVGTPPGVDSGGGDSLTSHGSWVSSAAVGKKFGNCPECLLIILEGDTVDAIDAAYLWAAQQPWIDVITSSTSIGLIGAGSNPGLFPGFHDAAVEATNNGKIFLNAAGNGAGNAGLVPTSTFLLGSSSPAAIAVGASSTSADGTGGFSSHWSDFPAEIMANGNQRGVADTASMKGETAVGGTSFSSPGAAGVLARSLLEARRTCNDFTEGVSSTSSKNLLRNINATGGCAVTAGPAANGVLTRDELHEAFVKNAVPPYDQLTTIPGPIGWAKNAYGWVDLGNGINNGGMTIQPAVTKSILGTQAIPVRALEQFWYDGVVREGQSFIWGSRPVADGDSDAFPRDDGACMPDCAPDELERYATGFAGLSSSSTYQDLFNILGVSAQQFAQHGASGLGVLRRPTTSVAGVVAETGNITFSNDQTNLTVRLALSGALDGLVPTVNSTPISYEVLFSANHNGVAQEYRVSYEFEAVDLLGLLDGVISDPLQDKFEVFADTLPDPASQISSICPITTDISASHYDLETGEAVWIIPLSAFSQDNRPVGQSCTFTNGGRALQSGDKLTDIAGSSVLTVAVVNFGNGLGLFGESEADDYTLSGGTQTDTDGDGVPDNLDQCANTPVGADISANGCPLLVPVTVNGQMAGAATLFDGEWSLDINFDERAPVDGAYIVEAIYGTASEVITLQASGGGGATPITAALSATPTAGESPLLVQFNASGTTGGGEGRRYTFVFGDGARSLPLDSATASHTYEGAASYQAYVIVTDAGGRIDESDRVTITSQMTIVVEDDAETVAQLTADTMAGQAPLTVNFGTAGTTVKAGASISNYRFDFGDGQVVDGTSTTARHVYTVPGPYTAVLTITDSVGGSNSDTVDITVTANDVTVAVLDVNGPRSGPAPFAVSFDGSKTVAKTDTTIQIWVFDAGEPGDDDIQTGTGHPPNSIAHTYSVADSYEPSLTVTDSSQVQAQAKVRVTAHPSPAAPPGTPANPASPVAQASSSQGGGGSAGLLLLLPLLAVASRRRRQR